MGRRGDLSFGWAAVFGPVETTTVFGASESKGAPRTVWPHPGEEGLGGKLGAIDVVEASLVTGVVG